MTARRSVVLPRLGRSAVPRRRPRSISADAAPRSFMLRAVGGCAYQSGAKRSWRSGAAGAHDKTMSTVHNGVSPRAHAVQAAAALAASMGIGRFVYTPILPLMHTQAGLSALLGATLATANYLGYLIGALAGILIPG